MDGGGRQPPGAPGRPRRRRGEDPEDPEGAGSGGRGRLGDDPFGGLFVPTALSKRAHAPDPLEVAGPLAAAPPPGPESDGPRGRTTLRSPAPTGVEETSVESSEEESSEEEFPEFHEEEPSSSPSSSSEEEEEGADAAPGPPGVAQMKEGASAGPARPLSEQTALADDGRSWLSPGADALCRPGSEPWSRRPESKLSQLTEQEPHPEMTPQPDVTPPPSRVGRHLPPQRASCTPPEPLAEPTPELRPFPPTQKAQGKSRPWGGRVTRSSCSAADEEAEEPWDTPEDDAAPFRRTLPEISPRGWAKTWEDFKPREAAPRASSHPAGSAATPWGPARGSARPSPRPGPARPPRPSPRPSPGPVQDSSGEVTEAAVWQLAQQRLDASLRLANLNSPSVTDYPRDFQPKLGLADLNATAQEAFLRAARLDAGSWLQEEQERALWRAAHERRRLVQEEQLARWHEQKQAAEEAKRRRELQEEEEQARQEQAERDTWRRRARELRQRVVDWAIEKEERTQEEQKAKAEAAKAEQERRRNLDEAYRAKQQVRLEAYRRRRAEQEERDAENRRLEEEAAEEARIAEEKAVKAARARRRRRLGPRRA